MNIQYSSLTQCTVKFLHWVIQVILKLFCLNLRPYSFNKFFKYNQKDLWLVPFLQVKVSVVNSAGASFHWDYATDTFYGNYADANVCCNYAGFEVLLQLYRWYFMLQLCWWIFFVAITQVNVSVAVMELEVSATFMQVKVSATNMWVTIFIEIMHVGVCSALYTWPLSL